jgi:hypothetical protein
LAVLAVGAALVVLFFAAGLIGAFGKSIPQELWAAAGALGGALVGVLVPAPKSPPTPGASAAVSVVHGAALGAATAAGQAIVASDSNQANAVKQAIAAVKTTAEAGATGGTTGAITTAVDRHRQDAATTGPAQQVLQAAADAAEAAVPEALSRSQAMGGGFADWSTWIAKGTGEAIKVLGLAAVAYFALRVGIRLSDGTISYTSCVVHTPIAKDTSQAPCATALFAAATAMITLGASAAGALVGLFAPTPG